MLSQLFYLGNTLAISTLFSLIPVTKVEGWGSWHQWNDFPHHKIQLGMSNQDYGGLMDMEYICFGSVGEENQAKKSKVYWFRIADRIERFYDSNYVQIEVGCWVEDKFKAKTLVKGIMLSSPE